MLNKTITIDSIEMKQASTGNWKYIIKDKEGDKYYFYKDTKNGESEAYISFNNLDPKAGDNLTIGYSEEDDTFTNKDGKVISYKKRFIGTIISGSSNPLPMAEKRNTGHSVASGSSFSGNSGETNWDEIAVGKCQTAFLAAYIQAGHTFDEAKLQAGQARRLAEVVVYGHTQTPKEEVQEDVSVKDVPF